MLKKQTITSYQYGTHVIVTETGEHALTSTTIDLDAFTDQAVIVAGRKIQGYPLEDGPEYLEVESVVQLPGE